MLVPFQGSMISRFLPNRLGLTKAIAGEDGRGKISVVNLLTRVSIFWKALRELGPRYVLQYAGYQAGLRLGCTGASWNQGLPMPGWTRKKPLGRPSSSP